MPLASGLLTGKFDARHDASPRDDHRAFNRHGEAFDVGETFPGVDFERGLEAVEELRPLVPEGATLAQLALRWILEFDAVSTVIPGAKTPEQARANAAAADLPALRRRHATPIATSTASTSHRTSTSAGKPATRLAAPRGAGLSCDQHEDG